MKAPHSVNAPHFGRTVNAAHFGRKLNENPNGINAWHLVIVVTTQYKSSSLFVTSLGGLQIVRIPRKGLQFVQFSPLPKGGNRDDRSGEAAAARPLLRTFRLSFDSRGSGMGRQRPATVLLGAACAGTLKSLDGLQQQLDTSP